MNKGFAFKNVVGTLLIGLVMRKIFIGREAMKTVAECRNQVSVESMLNSTSFLNVAQQMSKQEPALILMLNRHALNMTQNWLCNTKEMSGVHKRSLIVTLDAETDVELEKNWPNVQRLHWPVECLREPFNYGDGKYQLLYLFRANLALALLRFGRPFWMIQQDTFWRENLLELDLNDPEFVDKDVIFDQAAETTGSLIAGGYYLARPTFGAIQFFKTLSADLEWWYAPDNTYMTSLCARHDLAHCGQIPFNTITNWIWLHEPSRFKRLQPPKLIQFDGDTKLGGKLAKMRSLGFYFLHEDNNCNVKSVKKANEKVIKWTGISGTLDAIDIRSYSHLQFSIYQAIIDQLYKFYPTEWLLNHFIFPYAHYFMITL